MSKEQNWKPVIDKFNSKLANWKARSISYGGRLTLVKSVLSSLPLYYFSLFRAPLSVIKNLESIRRNFFWVGTGECSKLSWVKWDEGLLPYEDGGLNIGSLSGKNLALLGKWFWRAKIEPKTLWVLIKSVMIEKMDIKFASSFSKIIGDGSDTRFWEDPWVCGLLVREVFLKNRLTPIKVAIFIWRALKRRIPVRIELDKRGIDLDSVRCPLCDDDVETIEHTLIFCRHAMDIWVRVYKWWGLGTVSNLSIDEIFRGKCNRSLSPLWSSIWQAIEWTCGYLIWKNRNQKVFSDSSWSGPTGLMEIQLKSFEWISNRLKNRKLDWLGWISKPWSCLV
ncbi:uncharacterized protein [Rutidosis leptorrhynchoides]|uniref:uncharacterized protein n=1 Tax=Rutidosis leptorrhynchoides TaxID=125765 RepID=UPI003A9A0342